MSWKREVIFCYFVDLRSQAETDKISCRENFLPSGTYFA